MELLDGSRNHRIRVVDDDEAIHQDFDKIATSILHNVGNVLNSVNASLSTVAETVARSRIPRLEKTAALLSSHLADVSSFLTRDPKGKQIPAFVIAVSGGLTAERENLQKEIELLTKNIEHIKVIISVQQSHAKVSRLVDQVSIEDLLLDALAVNAAGLDQARIRVVHQHEDVPRIALEKHKVLQILVNLISNAKHAMSVSVGRERTLTLGTRVVGGVVEISVRDNGVGIPKENLRKIFQHGFTTRSDGHGFGLHGSAIAATEMHGSLTVASEGKDRGAVFVLSLPLMASGVGASVEDGAEEARGITRYRGAAEMG